MLLILLLRAKVDDQISWAWSTINRLNRGWSGGAMVLGKLPVPGRPTIFITVGQGPIALAVGAGVCVCGGGGGFGHFYSHLSFLFFLPLFGRHGPV